MALLTPIEPALLSFFNLSNPYFFWYCILFACHVPFAAYLWIRAFLDLIRYQPENDESSVRVFAGGLLYDRYKNDGCFWIIFWLLCGSTMLVNMPIFLFFGLGHVIVGIFVGIPCLLLYGIYRVVSGIYRVGCTEGKTCCCIPFHAWFHRGKKEGKVDVEKGMELLDEKREVVSEQPKTEPDIGQMLLDLESPTTGDSVGISLGPVPDIL